MPREDANRVASATDHYVTLYHRYIYLLLRAVTIHCDYEPQLRACHPAADRHPRCPQDALHGDSYAIRASREKDRDAGSRPDRAAYACRGLIFRRASIAQT